MPALSPQEFVSHDYSSDPVPPADLLRAYRLMALSRKFNKRCWILHRQGKIAFTSQASGRKPANWPRDWRYSRARTTISRTTATW